MDADGSDTPTKEQEELKLRELAMRHANACDKVLRATRYPFGYLRDMPYQIIPKLEQNPIEVTIRVWWAEEEFSWASLPSQFRLKIEELEKQISEISKSILGMQISKPIERKVE